MVRLYLFVVPWLDSDRKIFYTTPKYTTAGDERQGVVVAPPWLTLFDIAFFDPIQLVWMVEKMAC